MMGAPKPLTVVVHHDILCAWCYVADFRLEELRRQLGSVVRFKFRPFPVRPHEIRPSAREVARAVKELRRAQKEPEGKLLRPDLWQGEDLPRSSLGALAALEAARLQGPEARHLLWRAMQRTALEQGVNVTRSDVIFELASRAGLQMNRFSAAYRSPETKRLILEEYRLASGRGVEGVPTLVLGGRWMLSGLRDLAEYKDHILSCVGKWARTAKGAGQPTVH